MDHRNLTPITALVSLFQSLQFALREEERREIVCAARAVRRQLERESRPSISSNAKILLAYLQEHGETDRATLARAIKTTSDSGTFCRTIRELLQKKLAKKVRKGVFAPSSSYPKSWMGTSHKDISPSQ